MLQNKLRYIIVAVFFARLQVLLLFHLIQANLSVHTEDFITFTAYTNRVRIWAGGRLRPDV